jgi:hypothetical protein
MLRPLFDFVRTADTVIFSAPRSIIAGKQRAKKDGKIYINNCIPCAYTDLNSPMKSKNPPRFRRSLSETSYPQHF